jgi:multidrug efflux system membrane fusion protein
VLAWVIALLVVAAGIGYFFYNRAANEISATAQADAQGGGQGGAARGGSGAGRQGKGGPGGAGGQANRPLPVVAEDAKSGDMEVFLNALGSVTPLNVVTVRTRVDGQMLRVAFREGQVVRAGDLLAEIDPRPFQVQLTQAEGQMARDQALLRNAKLDVDRYAQLFAQDSIARQQLDTQRALVAQYEGAVKADQGAIDNAKLQLTYARITAPISGRLGLRQVDAGNVVHAGDTNGIVVITQVQPISVVFTLPEDALARVIKRRRENSRLPVVAYDREHKVKLASGVLQSLDNQIDVTTGTVKLKAQFDNADESLFPNQFVNVQLLIDTLHDAVLVATAAIQRGNQGTFVYVVKEDSSVSVRPVTLGPARGETTSIAAGLKAGEKVVVDGADKLREGGKVEVITREMQNAPGPGGGRRGGQGGGRRRDGDGAAAPVGTQARPPDANAPAGGTSAAIPPPPTPAPNGTTSPVQTESPRKGRGEAGAAARGGGGPAQ